MDTSTPCKHQCTRKETTFSIEMNLYAADIMNQWKLYNYLSQITFTHELKFMNPRFILFPCTIICYYPIKLNL